MTFTRAQFSPADHPRAPAGTDSGGEFAKDAGGKKQTKKPATGDMAYDPKSKHGTGYGAPDPRVKKLQTALNRLGLTDAAGKKLRVDGELGPKTTAAIKAAQKRLGLPQNGRVTPALLKRLVDAKALPERSAMDLCVRSFDFDLRGQPGDGLTLEGYAAVFNSPTKIRDAQGEFEETILPGAFTRSLAARMPVLQWDHGRDPAVGTAPIGDIQDLREDDHGLLVRARLYDHPTTGRVRMAITGKSVKGMSFRFGVPDGGDAWSKRDGRDVREIRDADVHELGPVVFPAYDSTTVSVRSLLAQLDPDEHAALIRELAAELRRLPDLSDLVGQPSARSADGDEENGTEPGSGVAPTAHLRQRLDEGALRARGIK